MPLLAARCSSEKIAGLREILARVRRGCLEQERMLVGLEQLQPHVREDRRLDELHQLVDLEQEGDRDLDLGELEHELRRVLVELCEEAHRE